VAGPRTLTRTRRLPLLLALGLVGAYPFVRRGSDRPEPGTDPSARPAAETFRSDGPEAEPPRVARVRGYVHDASGEAVESLLVRLRPVGSPPASGTRPVDVRTDARGRFDVAIPAPGRYRVVINSYLHEPAEQQLHVAPGDDPVLSFDLRRLPGAGDVAGRLVSESGRYRFPVHVTLAPAGHVPVALRQVQWRPDETGAYVGRFRFEDVPWDDYVVRLWPRADQVCEWTTLEQRARPPATELEFVCLDAAPVAALEFEPYDAATGAPVDEFELCLSFDHGLLPPHCRRGPSGRRFEDVWLNQRLRWSLEADGYEPAQGDLETWAVDRGVECGLERSFSIPLRRKPLPDDAILDASRPVDGPTGSPAPA